MQRIFADSQCPTDKVVFTYDAASRMTQAVSNRYQNTVTRNYNDDATIASEGLTTNGQNYQISHFFDTAKRNYQTTYPNGKANTRPLLPEINYLHQPIRAI